MKYTDIVKAAPKATLQYVDKTGVVYLLEGENASFQLTIPFHKIQDVRLIPNEKTIYLARLIRECMEENASLVINLKPNPSNV